MQLVIYAIGAGSLLLFIVNNVIQTIRRRKEIGFWELTLAFFVALMPSIALIIDNTDDAAFSTLEQATFLLVIPLAITHIALTVVESFRPQGIRQSRGLLGIGLAILLALASVSYSFISIQAELRTVDQNPRPTPVNNLDQRDPCVVAGEDLIRELVNDLLGATGLTLSEALTRIEDDPSLSIAILVENNGLDADQFIRDTASEVVVAIEELLSRGCLTTTEATAARFAVPGLVRQAVTNDFDVLLNQFAPDDTAEQIEALSPTDIVATRQALEDFLAANPTELPTVTPTYTPSNTPTPTVTRTPRPTDSPTPTRIRFQTATPTLTPTLPNPCIAQANFNVNMRTLPDLDDGDVILTIPFESVITVYAPNPDETWWYGLYDGEVGWVSGEFIALADACFDLPPRRP